MLTKDYKHTIDMTQTKPNRDLEIYRYTQFVENIAPGYKYPSLLIFTKEIAKQAVFDYLYNGKGGVEIDIKFSNGIKNKGWLTCTTLYFMRIKPGVGSKGSLKKLGASSAQKVISDAIDAIYQINGLAF